MANRKKYPRIQFYVPEEVRASFYDAVARRYGKTSGGAVSESGGEAIKMWINKEKEKSK